MLSLPASLCSNNLEISQEARQAQWLDKGNLYHKPIWLYKGWVEMVSTRRQEWCTGLNFNGVLVEPPLKLEQHDWQRTTGSCGCNYLHMPLYYINCDRKKRLLWNIGDCWGCSGNISYCIITFAPIIIIIILSHFYGAIVSFIKSFLGWWMRAHLPYNSENYCCFEICNTKIAVEKIGKG